MMEYHFPESVSIEDEPVIPKRQEPEGYGYTRRTKAEFAAYNEQATAELKAADMSIVQYTYALPDEDPDYVWVREEGIYTKRLPPAEKVKIKTHKEAIAATMKIPKFGEIV